jgi:hypothetical protein
MGLNDIKLSPTLAAELYRTTLVEGPFKKILPDGREVEVIVERIEIVVEEDAPEPPPPPPAGKKTKTKETAAGNSKSLGGNQKNILVVVNYDNVVHIPDEELEFLTSILKACQLSLDDVAIVNTKNFPGDGYKEYAKKFSSRIVLLFGVDPVSFDLPVNFPEFQVQSLTNTTFLYSPTLSECRTNKLLKSKLWVSLQRIFGL